MSSDIESVILEVDGPDAENNRDTITNDFIDKFETVVGIPFNRVDIFNDERRLTESRVVMNEHLTDMSQLTIIVSDKPIRIMDKDIRQLVDEAEIDMEEEFSIWGIFSDELETTFGNVEDWDVSFVTNMEWWFAAYPDNYFVGDISKWDVSSVTNMSSMFSLNEYFNCELDKWDVSKVTDMVDMFLGAVNYNQDLSSWDVSNVVDFTYMFAEGCGVDKAAIIDSWNLSDDTVEVMFD